MKLSREQKRLRRRMVEVRDKIIAFGIVLVFLIMNLEENYKKQKDKIKNLKEEHVNRAITIIEGR
uniref:Uncharacterized protein n=1 Tax=Candidatus Methanophagaceae archaeon ANME-1 ERB6 TaxID=2759912 RepID=A0A7G9YT37_9EURY|nr:hypothetical protein NIPIMIJO_00011 [Methanosarcinales archaeon ANME-1 ERB6]